MPRVKKQPVPIVEEKLVPYDEMHHAWSRLRTEYDNYPCRLCVLCGRFEFIDARFPIQETKCSREVINPVRAPIGPEEMQTAEARFWENVAAGKAVMKMTPFPRELE